MWADALLAGLIGGLIALDRSVAFQVMISRPLVAAPLIGLVLGQPLTGILVGGLLELIWMGRPPLGGAIPPSECLGAIVITGGVIMASPDAPASKALISLGLVIGLPLARLGALLEKQRRKVNGTLLRRAQALVAAGRPAPLFGYNLAGLALAYLASFLFIIVLAPILARLLMAAGPALPRPVWEALELLYVFIPIIGVAAALSTLTAARALVAFSLTFVCLLVVLNL